MRFAFTVPLLLSFALSACSGNIQTYHCDLRTGAEPEDRCQERSVDALVGATSSVQYQELCSSEFLGGTSGDGPCPRDNAIAACDFDDEGLESVTDVYYAPETLEEATRECESDGTLVDP